MNKNKGFTLIEVLVVIGIIAILAAIVIVAINPAKRFRDARNSQRMANVEAIMSAVQQYMVDNKGKWTCSTVLPDTLKIIKSTSGGVNIASCLNSYLAVLPFDPMSSSYYFTSDTDYNTGYEIKQDSITKQITISAPEALNDEISAPGISVTR